MPKKKANLEVKKEIGSRFFLFRKSIGKRQRQLASELKVTQSTIANIECGKAFPNLTYLQHFYHRYRLNINWLFTNQGNMFVDQKSSNDEYLELINLLQVPMIEQIIMAKFIETKALLKDHIESFYQENAKEETGGVS